jgi:hypothetical protein
MRDIVGNLPVQPGVFPDYAAPIVRNGADGVRELAPARWGMPSSHLALWDRIDAGYFSVLNELVVRLWGRLEHAGRTMADKAPDGTEADIWDVFGASAANVREAGIPTLYSACFNQIAPSDNHRCRRPRKIRELWTELGGPPWRM